MFCRHCGSQLSETAAFCAKCGKPRTREESVRADDPSPGTELPGLGHAALPDAHQGVSAGTTAAPAKPTGGGFIVLPLVVAALVVLALGGGFAVAYFTGTLAPLGIAPATSAAARDGRTSGDKAASEDRANRGDASSDDEATEDDADGSGEGEPESYELTEGESFDVLAYHYERVWTLHEYIGLANADGSYGGTGFAYTVFNSGIGNPDYDERVQLVDDCQLVLDTIRESRTELESEQLAAEYREQSEALLSLYDLLEARMAAMYGAAEIAVDDPDEASWRPALSPASVNARKQFEAEYPTAQPVSQ